MEDIRVNERSPDIILSQPHAEDVTSYFLEEVNSGEDTTSDILTLALREASQDTCHSIEHMGSSYDPMGEVSVSMGQSRNANINDTGAISGTVQGKFTLQSQRQTCDNDLTAALTQCDSGANLNESQSYFAIENNGVSNSACNTTGNSLSIRIEQLVNSLNNFDSSQMENRQALVTNSLSETENNGAINDGVSSAKVDNGNEIQREKYFQDSILSRGNNITENGNIQNSQDNESSPSVSSELGHLSAVSLNNSTINTQNLVLQNPTKSGASNSIPPKVSYIPANLKPATLIPTTSSDLTVKAYIPIQAAAPVKYHSLVPPLGSSNNPIQVIQHGNTYHSTQALTNEQLQQIALVLQQQQQQQQQQNVAKITDNNGAVLYNPDTNTRIIYRVVYPADAKQLETRENENGGLKTFSGSVNKSKGRPRKTWTKKPEPDVPRADGQELSKEEKEEKKKHRPRTRYGRISKPPSYMIKDYKRIHHLDFDQEPYDDSDGGYSDFQQSEDEGDSTSERRSRLTNCAIVLEKDTKKTLPPGVTTIKPRNYKCPTCEKAYIGKGGLERHFRLSPGHGSIEDFEDNAQEVFSDDNSNASGGSQGSNEDIGKTYNVDNTPDQNIPPQKCSIEDLNNAKKNRHRTGFSSGYYARRKAKLKDLIQPYQDDELLELLLPRLSKLVNLWDFLLLKSERGDPAEPDIPDIFKQFEELVQRLQVVCRDCLVLSSTNTAYNRGNKEGETSVGDSKLYVEVASDRVASALGITAGLYEVKRKELLELVPSILKPTRKRKSDDCSSSEKENSAFSKDAPKKLCSKNIDVSILMQEGRNGAPGLNFISQTPLIATSQDSLGDLSIPDPILTHSVSMMDENNFHLDELEENTNINSQLSIDNRCSVSASDSLITTSLPTDQYDKTMTRRVFLNSSNKNLSDTNTNPSSNNSVMNKNPSIGNALLPSLSLENSLLFNGASLSPSRLVTDAKSSSNLYQVKKVNLFGSPVNRDSFLTLENSQDSLPDPISKDQTKVDDLESTYILTRSRDRQTSLSEVPLHHSEGDNGNNGMDISQSSIVSDNDMNMVSVPKPANSAIESYIISENETPCLFSQTNESGNITLFKGDCHGNDNGTSMLMDFNSKPNEISRANFHEMVVDLENESGDDNNCLVGLLVNTNNEKKEDMRRNQLAEMNLDDMNEEVTNIFDEKHSSENEIEKHNDIENSFLPGNVIIVQNPDGTTTLQVPGNQVFSLEALQALFGLEQESPLCSGAENLGNSITLNSQLADIGGHDSVLMGNLNS